MDRHMSINRHNLKPVISPSVHKQDGSSLAHLPIRNLTLRERDVACLRALEPGNKRSIPFAISSKLHHNLRRAPLNRPRSGDVSQPLENGNTSGAHLPTHLFVIVQFQDALEKPRREKARVSSVRQNSGRHVRDDQRQSRILGHGNKHQ